MVTLLWVSRVSLPAGWLFTATLISETFQTYYHLPGTRTNEYKDSSLFIAFYDATKADTLGE
jgi:hypothetical protein